MRFAMMFCGGALLMSAAAAAAAAPSRISIPYDRFLQNLTNGSVQSVEFGADPREIVGVISNAEGAWRYASRRATEASADPLLQAELTKAHIQPTHAPMDLTSNQFVQAILLKMLSLIIPVTLLVMVFVMNAKINRLARTAK